jgi:RimJ/RimL family protein N-acetyltransferase
MFPSSELTTARLRLRPFRAEDAAEVHAVWHDERFVQTAPIGYPYAKADLETAVEWCTTGVEQLRRNGKGAGFAVEPREGGRLVGHVALFDADWVTRVVEIHYWTAPWARGHRYAAEAAGAAARWALLDVGFARVSLLAATDNPASRNVAESAGFQFEGVLRRAGVKLDGRRADVAAYSMIREDLTG